MMPQSGREAVEALIDAATRTIALKIYLLSEPALIAALVRAQTRGVLVRVMLNEARRDGTRDNDATRSTLERAGIEMRWGSGRFAATHEKSMVIDGESALIASFNFGEKYFSETRDYGIVTHDRVEVAEVVACFEADWDGLPFVGQPESRLLWSPGFARRQIAALIATATRTVCLQHAKLVDTTVLLQLLMATERGVKVRFLCAGAHGLHDWDRPETFAALRILHGAGGRVKRLKSPKMHGNLTLVDDRAAQLGSMHFHHVANDTRRELAIELNDPEIVAALAAQFAKDWSDAERYAPPDPIAHGDTDQVDAEVFLS